MKEKILIVDFGSQYTQLIARRVRELNIFSEITPFDKIPDIISNFKGIILSGSPASVDDPNCPIIDSKLFNFNIPILAICYSAQLISKNDNGSITRSKIREFGRANLSYIKKSSLLFKGFKINSQVWMSHGDTINKISDKYEILASTKNVKIAAFKSKNSSVYGIQFHPEVYHTIDGKKIFNNFLIDICKFKQLWTPKSFIHEKIKEIKSLVKNDKVILGLSGGVDSTVSAVLLNKAIGKKLYCIFIDNGLLRKNEFKDVLENFKKLGLNVIGLDSKNKFYSKLKGVSDPEKKRKIIGNLFIKIFENEAKKIKNVKWLAQGTIYPDVIESISVNGGPSSTIKSHHNVGGLPKKMNLKILEPIKLLFKDEVRNIGKSLNIPSEFINRHPFPGPGLAIRIIGEINKKNINLLQKVDSIFIKMLKSHGFYEKIWQAGSILLPIKTVGVMGDERTYENVVALRAVSSVDGMTADWYKFPNEFLSKLSNEIINKVRGVNRVVYDISSKPPSTIEWE